MYERQAVITNPTGLHARPASDFVAEAKKHAAWIKIGRTGEEKTVDAKSILMLLSLGLKQGTQIVLKAEGEDEREAVDALIALIESGFGEV